MKLKPETPYGECRIVTRFALLPTTLSNGTRIWLEKYKEEQKWTRGSGLILSVPDFWSTVKTFQ